MAAPLIENVSDTAFWVAHHRGLEGNRPDALFRDPLALRLAGERGRQIAQSMPHGPMTGWVMAIRTCIIDDYVSAAVADGADTVLNLGAGLDTRPYRMELPTSLTWIEVDYPAVIDFKEASSRPRRRAASSSASGSISPTRPCAARCSRASMRAPAGCWCSPKASSRT